MRRGRALPRRGRRRAQLAERLERGRRACGDPALYRASIARPVRDLRYPFAVEPLKNAAFAGACGEARSMRHGHGTAI